MQRCTLSLNSVLLRRALERLPQLSVLCLSKSTDNVRITPQHAHMLLRVLHTAFLAWGLIAARVEPLGAQSCRFSRLTPRGLAIKHCG